LTAVQNAHRTRVYQEASNETQPTLTIASLLSILFFTFHLADDIVRGIEPGQLSNLAAVATFVFWMYGTLVLAERRSGYIINSHSPKIRIIDRRRTLWLKQSLLSHKIANDSRNLRSRITVSPETTERSKPPYPTASWPVALQRCPFV